MKMDFLWKQFNTSIATIIIIIVIIVIIFVVIIIIFVIIVIFMQKVTSRDVQEIAGSIAVSSVLFLISLSCTCDAAGDDDG